MEIATIPSKRRKNLIIIAILLVGLPILVYASYQVYQLITRASVEAKPTNVVLSNITTSSVTVTWVTEVSSNGTIIPVENGSEKSPILDRRGSGKRYTHYVEITDLSPDTEYQFIIVSDSKKYTSDGSKNFTFKTAQISSDVPTPNPIHGTVQGNSGDDVLLYAMLKDKSTYPVSTVMPTGGNWIMDISALRKTSDKSLVITSDSTNLVIIAVSGTNKGAILEGTYGELFDSSGKLKDTYSLSLANNTSLYSSFPSVAMLEAYSSVTTTKTETNSSSTNNNNVEEEEKVEEENVGERKFRIVQQLEWIDMVVGDESISGEYGESTIRAVNITDTGFTILWISNKKEQGYINYGTSKTSLTNQGSDERDGITNKGSYYVHSISITRLQPETEYYFEIVSGDSKYNNSGKKYSLKTFATLSSPPPFESVTGQVSSLPDHKEAIVIAQIQDKDSTGTTGNSLPISTIIDENGKWILSIADSRSSDGSKYFEYTSEDILSLEIYTTVETEIVSEKINGISDRDISISMSDISTSSTSYTNVALLDNYGILGYSSGVSINTDSSEEDSTYTVQSGNQIPKTGILEDFFILIILSFGLLVSGILMYRKTMTKSQRKGKMTSNI